jgi:hypothetical protein
MFGWILRRIRRRRDAKKRKREQRAARALPPSCLRGLSKSKLWSKKNGLKAEVFFPQESTLEKRRAAGKATVGQETSVNWEDDAGAVDLTLADGKTAAHGAARLRIEALEKVKSNFGMSPPVPERDPIPRGTPGLRENPYHGNLVYPESLQEHEIVKIAAFLALFVEESDIIQKPPPA